MRPEIADTLMTHFYARLTNAPSTRRRSAMRGVPRSLIFVQHEVAEDARFSTSSSNAHEREWAIAICEHLLKQVGGGGDMPEDRPRQSGRTAHCHLVQGYAAERMTILVTYGEQLRAISATIERRPELADVLVRTVDSYQGEENDIVVLSLVRSNRKNKIGFLRVSMCARTIVVYSRRTACVWRCPVRATRSSCSATCARSSTARTATCGRR